VITGSVPASLRDCEQFFPGAHGNCARCQPRGYRAGDRAAVPIHFAKCASWLFRAGSQEWPGVRRRRPALPGV